MTDRPHSSEALRSPVSGWPILISLVLVEAALVVAVLTLQLSETWLIVLALAGLGLLLLVLPGFYVVGPNMSRALVLFGKYKGTVRRQGFFWTNPFTLKMKLSLKAHNLASEKIKVNDQMGNPIEIGAVVVWLVRDTAQALFDVEDYLEFVDVQVEAAVRQLASSHPYDEFQADAGVVSLRGDSEEVALELQKTLGSRLDRAGIEVLEARLSHLAYAPEIASAMLQRQQAQAIIAARQQIVEGAVSMVEQALADLGARKVVELDDERRAALVGNLLVVLCGQASPQPILQTGGQLA